MKKNEIDDVEVYKEYLKIKGVKNKSVVAFCKIKGIPRPTLYSIINRIEKGDEVQLNRCIMKGKYNCLWEHKYKRRFFIIEEMQGTDYHQNIKSLIRDMFADGFGVRDLARRVCKDVSTISYHRDRVSK